MSAGIQYDISQLAALLASRAEDVARRLLPNGELSSDKKHWCVGSVAGEAGQSLKVTIRGEKIGFWKDFAGNADDHGDLVELWARTTGLEKSAALREIRDYLGINGKARSNVTPLPVPVPKQASKTPSVPAKQINTEYHRSMVTNLAKSEGAMAYLTGQKRGLELATIKHFGLGLSKPYTGEDGVTRSNAVTAPMRSLVNGEFLNKTAYINVPGVTQNPTDPNGWMKGEPQSYFAEARTTQRILFVCEGLKDVWRHWQALVKAGLTGEIMLVSSTHGSAFPAEWKSEEYWQPWSAIYLGHDNDDAGDVIAERLVGVVGREAFRIRVPAAMGKDWTDFWQADGSIEDFHSLLNEAPVASGATISEAPQEPGPSLPRIGRFSHKPVDINGAYVNGHFYYTTETHVIKKDDESGQLVERLETIVIRSDRTVHRANYAPAPPGTPLNKRVLKLSDGTIIEKEPRTSLLCSWDYGSIQLYLEGKAKPRSLKAIVIDVLAALQQAIWLPYGEDYVALALTVPVTYLQAVFESVPLLLLNGPAGSGKTQTGNAMAKLCANGTVIGQVSAATAARMIDETRGFVALDDVEGIAAKTGKDPQVNEFVQALKVSYNKHTAVKYWTDVKTMKTERLDFFGVKLLSNTLGADAILGSRMIRIQTRKMPSGMVSTSKDFSVEDLRALRELRNELHTWAFENVEAVAKAYGEVYVNKTDRQAEIAAPLRTIAKLIGDPALSAKLEACLARQHLQQTVVSDDPVETLKEAVRNLIKQGFDTVTLTHLSLEMRVLLDANFGMSSTTEIPEFSRPEWIGRQLRSNDLVGSEDLGRKRVYGHNLRQVRFSDWMVKQVTHDEAGNPIYVTDKKPEAFCQGCQACPYRNTKCDLQNNRMREESRSAQQRAN